MAFKTDKAVSARAIVTPLAETFRKGTTTFKQVKRLGRVIIYELTSKPTKERPDPMVQFEVGYNASRAANIITIDLLRK